MQEQASFDRSLTRAFAVAPVVLTARGVHGARTRPIDARGVRELLHVRIVTPPGDGESVGGRFAVPLSNLI